MENKLFEINSEIKIWNKNKVKTWMILIKSTLNHYWVWGGVKPRRRVILGD